jgi:hypothetical protein
LGQAEILSEVKPLMAFVHRGYRNVERGSSSLISRKSRMPRNICNGTPTVRQNFSRIKSKWQSSDRVS